MMTVQKYFLTSGEMGGDNPRRITFLPYRRMGILEQHKQSYACRCVCVAARGGGEEEKLKAEIEKDKLDMIKAYISSVEFLTLSCQQQDPPPQFHTTKYLGNYLPMGDSYLTNRTPLQYTYTDQNVFLML